MLTIDLYAMVSKVGEVVPFHSPINILHGTCGNFKLKEAESQMKILFSCFFESAVVSEETMTLTSVLQSIDAK
jgi:hypothetical protein